MNAQRYKYAIYAIIGIITVVISIQIYWNVLNYQNNKIQLVNDVQVSLDNAVNIYFADEAEKNTLALEPNEGFDIFEDETLDSITKRIDRSKSIAGIDSVENLSSDKVKIYQGKQADSAKQALELKNSGAGFNVNNTKYNEDGVVKGSTKLRIPEVTMEDLKAMDEDTSSIKSALDIDFLTSQIIITYTSDSIPLKVFDTIVKKELARKNIRSSYGLQFIKKDSTSSFVNKSLVANAELESRSESSFLPKGTSLLIYFDNPNQEVFLRSLTGIFISVVLILGVIGILFYLLKIINNQKQLAEMKNDLISNITHEFKTPIATVSAAVEGMKHFDALKNKEKTRNYLDISEVQLQRLNLMVEKLLETATLDKDHLQFQAEKIDLTRLIQNCVDNHRMHLKEKTLERRNKSGVIHFIGDPFHLENAINNLIDNAVKYGGDLIHVVLNKEANYINIEVLDNGNGLKQKDLDLIFDKFYRVPKGDIHDVKGFGIGLYYTRKVIEKHGGTIEVKLQKNGTSFKINLPDGK
ncbi:sensor histidine kinase [Christiangramia marina]|uniref:sensor histidine kinase n=1 Tax=Christiangramia marina TaxID=409436 RepID=UPI003AA87BA1